MTAAQVDGGAEGHSRVIVDAIDARGPLRALVDPLSGGVVTRSFPARPSPQSLPFHVRVLQQSRTGFDTGAPAAQSYPHGVGHGAVGSSGHPTFGSSHYFDDDDNDDDDDDDDDDDEAGLEELPPSTRDALLFGSGASDSQESHATLDSAAALPPEPSQETEGSLMLEVRSECQ